jgi:serine/threonine-protein kinase RsbW
MMPADELIGLRRRLRDWLACAGLRGEAQDDLVLAASEAATNCIDHAYAPERTGSITVTCWTEHQMTFIEVADDGVWRPPPSDPVPGRGFGITMMYDLVDHLRILHDHHGTRVLLRCRTDTPPRPQGQP